MSAASDCQFGGGATAALMTLLAAEGVTGPGEAIEGVRGWADHGQPTSHSSSRSGRTPTRLMAVDLKQYPCFARPGDLGNANTQAAAGRPEFKARSRSPTPVPPAAALDAPGACRARRSASVCSWSLSHCSMLRA
jgi:hypothetical protein